MPCGSTHVDERVFDDLVSMIDLAELLINEIKESAEYKDRQEYSMSKVGSHANEFLNRLAKELNDKDNK